MSDTDGLAIAKVGARQSVVVALLGAVVAIVTTLLSSDVARVLVRSLRWPQREAALTADLARANSALAKLQQDLGTANEQLRNLKIVNAAINRDIELIANRRALPPSRFGFNYRKYDPKATNCLLAATAALRLATNVEPQSVTPGMLFSVSGQHKAATACYDSDGLVMFISIGPDLDTVMTLNDRIRQEFARVTGIE